MFRVGKTPIPKKPQVLDDSRGKILLTDRGVENVDSECNENNEGTDENKFSSSKMIKSKDLQVDTFLSKTMDPRDSPDLRIKNVFWKPPNPDRIIKEEVKFKGVGEIPGQPRPPFLRPDNIIDESKYYYFRVGTKFIEIICSIVVCNINRTSLTLGFRTREKSSI